MNIQAITPAFGLSVLKGAFIVIGVVIIVLAVATHLLDLELLSVFTWLEKAFGPLFIVLFGGLTILGLFSIAQLKHEKKAEVWFEVGGQAASGISTLALTFTLLGISLGIESLSQQPLTPETVGTVIQDLTSHFSTAFLTTVVGLPTAHIIRSVLCVRWVALNNSKQA
jgi:hypothetical protein